MFLSSYGCIFVMRLKYIFMATIKKTLSTKVDGQGYSQVLFRVSVNKEKKLRLKTGVFLPPKRWDEGKERMNYGKAVGLERAEMSEKETKLKDMEAKILKLCEIFPADILSKEWMENILPLCAGVETSRISVALVEDLMEQAQHPEKYAKRSFFDIMDDFRDNAKKKVNGKREGEKSEVWKKNFNVLVRALKRYEMFVRQSDSKRKDFILDIDAMDSDTIEDIESFLRNEHRLLEEYPKIFQQIPASTDTGRRNPKPQPRGNNAICTLFNKFKAFYNWANEVGITGNNPFKKYEGVTSEHYGTPYYITLEERNTIADYDLSSRPQLAIQRDIFVFHCCVGCRISDLYRLTEKSIVNGVLEYVPHKTLGARQNVVRVPLNARASALVEKYRGADSSGRLFPFISQQHYNESIKEVLKVCGVTRLVTILDSLTGQPVQKPINEVASSHMARRCFVGNLYKKVKDPNLIGSMSGHAEGSKAFARYREIDDEVKKEVVSLIG